MGSIWNGVLVLVDCQKLGQYTTGMLSVTPGCISDSQGFNHMKCVRGGGAYNYYCTVV